MYYIQCQDQSQLWSSHSGHLLYTDTTFWVFRFFFPFYPSALVEFDYSCSEPILECPYTAL